MNSRRTLAFVVAAPTLLAIAGCDKSNDTAPTVRETMPPPAGRTESSKVVPTPDNTAPRGTTNPPNRTESPRAIPAPDNTEKNKVDRSGETKTPMDQSESSEHIRTTADIRRAIMDDKEMSTNARNCKIITDKSGMVTLRGVVNSKAEKDRVGAKAAEVAGAAKVDNQLEIKVD